MPQTSYPSTLVYAAPTGFKSMTGPMTLKTASTVTAGTNYQMTLTAFDGTNAYSDPAIFPCPYAGSLMALSIFHVTAVASTCNVLYNKSSTTASIPTVASPIFSTQINASNVRSGILNFTKGQYPFAANEVLTFGVSFGSAITANLVLHAMIEFTAA